MRYRSSRIAQQLRLPWFRAGPTVFVSLRLSHDPSVLSFYIDVQFSSNVSLPEQSQSRRWITINHHGQVCTTSLLEIAGPDWRQSFSTTPELLVAGLTWASYMTIGPRENLVDEHDFP